MTHAPFGLPYAFFESLLIGAEFEDFLSPELKEKKDGLRAFLGEFHSVCFTDRDNEIALVQKRRERVHELRYFEVTVENGKITDIRG